MVKRLFLTLLLLILFPWTPSYAEKDPVTGEVITPKSRQDENGLDREEPSEIDIEAEFAKLLDPLEAMVPMSPARAKLILAHIDKDTETAMRFQDRESYKAFRSRLERTANGKVSRRELHGEGWQFLGLMEELQSYLPRVLSELQNTQSISPHAAAVRRANITRLSEIVGALIRPLEVFQVNDGTLTRLRAERLTSKFQTAGRLLENKELRRAVKLIEAARTSPEADSISRELVERGCIELI